MFKFNFQSDNLVAEKPECIENIDEFVSEHPCEEVSVSNTGDLTFKSVCIENFKFSIRDLDRNEENTALGFLTSYKNCDVIPSVYEGGLKVWECTYDLLMFLMHNEVDFRGKTVLDLGCGCGLLGIYAALKGAEVVHFQDYNADVLENFTIPNVRNNDVKSQTKFLSGDWNAFVTCSAIADVSYDYIVSSETLYCVRNYPKLCNLFVRKLRKEGEVFLASKSYYFGVGGSVKQFEEFLDRQKQFRWKTVWKNADGVQREILIVKLVNDVAQSVN